MINLAWFHPQIVHFAIVLSLTGVVARVVSLTGRARYTDAMATTLLVLGALAAIAAALSGNAAHPPVERIPGVRRAVGEHEQAGEIARTIFVVIGLIEIAALIVSRRRGQSARVVRYLHIASALVGLFGSTVIVRAAQLGGRIVYAFAGGPGVRSGSAEDIGHLFIAGVYEQALADRRSGHPDRAAPLFALMRERFPDDTTIRFMFVESLLHDARNPVGALAAIDSIDIRASGTTWLGWKAPVRADIWLALGNRDSARASLAPFAAAFPQNARLRARMDSLTR